MFVGDALDLSVSPALSSGTGNFTYQWKKGSANVVDGSGVTGAKTNNLKIASVASGDAGSYTVVVTESKASNSPVTSQAAAVTVDELPTIAAQSAITGKVGGSSTNFATMFTATNSAAADYNFVVTPTAAGTVSAAGAFTLADTASGTVTVKATHKVKTSVTATVSFTGVTPKLTGITVSSVTGGTLAGGAVGSNAAITGGAVGTPIVVTIAGAPTGASYSPYTVASGTPATATAPSGNQTGSTFTITPVAAGSTVVTITSGSVTRTINVTVAS